MSSVSGTLNFAADAYPKASATARVLEGLGFPADVECEFVFCRFRFFGFLLCMGLFVFAFLSPWDYC